MGALFAPVIIILMIVFSIIWMVGDSEESFVGYDEEVFQDYANEQYKAEFGRSSAYEDNLLIVFLTDEEHEAYAYIAWVGDHIAMDINLMLGADGTQLGEAMDNYINLNNYKYSLDSNLSNVVNALRKAIVELGLESSFICDETHTQVAPHLTNHTDLEMNTELVEDALAQFTWETRIPIVIVVEDMDDVFDTAEEAPSVGSDLWIGPVLIGAAVVIVIVVIIMSKKKKDQDDFGTPKKDSRYHEFDDMY